VGVPIANSLPEWLDDVASAAEAAASWLRDVRLTIEALGTLPLFPSAPPTAGAPTPTPSALGGTIPQAEIESIVAMRDGGVQPVVSAGKLHDDENLAIGAAWLLRERDVVRIAHRPQRAVEKRRHGARGGQKHQALLHELTASGDWMVHHSSFVTCPSSSVIRGASNSRSPPQRTRDP
jgi:hypothetical protein